MTQNNPENKNGYQFSVGKGLTWSIFFGVVALVSTSVTGLIALNLKIQENFVRNLYQDQGLDTARNERLELARECRTNFREVRDKIDNIKDHLEKDDRK